MTEKIIELSNVFKVGKSVVSMCVVLFKVIEELLLKDD
jgi:hypothetical protein